MARTSNFVTLLLLQLASFALAYGPNQSYNHSTASITTSRDAPLNNTNGMMMAHIGIMVVAWFFLLPVAVAFSIAKSRPALPVNLVFLALNGLGVVVGTIYNITTPDLYECNAHHSIGWIATWITITRAVIEMLLPYTRRRENSSAMAAEGAAFLPLPLANMTQEGMTGNITRPSSDHRGWSSETSSSCGSCSNSPTGSLHSNGGPEVNELKDNDIESELVPSRRSGLRYTSIVKKYLLARLQRPSSRLLGVLKLLTEIVDRTILILGFASLITGGVTYSGIFRGKHLFNGLAHFIKEGIFFWYGLLTLGRWAGCFANIGWAWNFNPAPIRVGRSTVPCPTAEFVESLVIFLYGCTNVFLEHLAAWGSAWTAQDLEHVSISVMFFGGGLCGMLVESNSIRKWLNTTAEAVSPHSNGGPIRLPKTSNVSMNPIPALIILLLGVMMSSHHQNSMTSTKVHKEWGMLLSGFSVMRILMYTVMYISQPTSIYPSRPPSELLSSFCLISGGIIFMASTKDVVHWMEVNDWMPMFVFTVAIGLSAFIMAWEILVLSLQGWATRREANMTAVSKSARYEIRR